LHPSGVAKSKTSFCGVTENSESAGWQVTLRDGIWHVSYFPVKLVANCYKPPLFDVFYEIAEHKDSG